MKGMKGARMESSLCPFILFTLLILFIPGASSSFASLSILPGLAFQDDDREIVNGAGFADEFCKGFVNPVANSRGCASTIFLNDFDQSRFTEFFP